MHMTFKNICLENREGGQAQKKAMPRAVQFSTQQRPLLGNGRAAESGSS